jgi:hypothetical protein
LRGSGVPARLGRPENFNRPDGAHVLLPAPSGYFEVWSPQAGVIVYRYHPIRRGGQKSQGAEDEDEDVDEPRRKFFTGTPLDDPAGPGAPVPLPGPGAPRVPVPLPIQPQLPAP